MGTAKVLGDSRPVLETLPDPALVLRRDGSIVDVSESAGRMLRRAPSDLVGRSLADLVTAQDKERLAAELAKVPAAGGMETTVAIEVSGVLRRINVRARQLGGDELLALLRDHTHFAARDRGRRLLLDHGPKIAAARDAEELWRRLWEAVGELLPRAAALRVYRGDEAAVRLAWASDLPPGTQLVFTVRGWGPKLLAMLQDPDRLEVFVDSLEGSLGGSRGRLAGLFSGRGNPLLLDDPDVQLRAFLTEEELQKVRALREQTAPPGQEILCPVVVDGRVDVVALVIGPPKDRPFSWDDAADVWQLVVLAREVLARVEAEERVNEDRRLARAYRQALRGIAHAPELEELYAAVGGEVLLGTGADGMVVLSGRRGSEVEWSRNLEPETLSEVRQVVVEILRRLGPRPEPVFLGSAGADEVVGELGAALREVEALAVVPAYLGGIHLATLVLTWAKPRVFGPDERALVEFLGVGLALALSNHQLGRRLSVLRDRVRRITGAVDQGVLEVDATGRVHFVNPLAMRLLGITNVEARHRALLSVVTPELREQLIPILERILRGHDVGSFNLVTGGRTLKVRVVMESEAGSIVRGPTSTWSITEQSGAEQRRLRLEKMLAASSEMVIDLAPDGTVLEANPAARRFLEQIGTLAGSGGEGKERSAMVWRLLGRDDLERLRNGEPVRKTGELLRPGGPPLVWEAELHALNTSGEMSILTVVHDRTERRALAGVRETLQRVADTVLGFEASIARLGEVVGRGHDLATAVMMQAGVSQGRTEDRERLARTMEILSESASKVLDKAPDDRRVILELETQLAAVRRALRSAVGVAGRVAWVIADRVRHSELIVQELERVGWNCRVVLPSDTLAQGGQQEPQVVVLDVGSLTMAVDLYGKIRASHPRAGILLAVPLGGATAGGLSEDPSLRIVEAVPSGQELQELLQTLASPAGGGAG
ncbi:MAG: PAS domain-containing protein [Acidobacteria bacterium]|nr:PAS domain-containing protein [Acidobacteriota bacterium]